jgi:hypothetical protein
MLSLVGCRLLFLLLGLCGGDGVFLLVSMPLRRAGGGHVSSCHPYSSLDHATMLVCGGHVPCATMYAHRGYSANHACAAAWLSQLLNINPFSESNYIAFSCCLALLTTLWLSTTCY